MLAITHCMTLCVCVCVCVCVCARARTRVPEIDEKQKDDNFKMKAFLLLFSDGPSCTCLEVKIF